MAVFGSGRGAFTPSTSSDNWTLEVTTTGPEYVAVIAIGWGGRGTASTGYRTRWTRPTINGITGTSTNIQKFSPASVSPSSAVCASWGVQPTLPSDPNNLFATDWNVHGGVGSLFLGDDDKWWFSGQSGTLLRQLSCRNVAGTDANASNYWVMWEE